MLIIAVVAVATGAFGSHLPSPCGPGGTERRPRQCTSRQCQPDSAAQQAGDGSVRLMDAADRVPRAGGGRTWFGGRRTGGLGSPMFTTKMLQRVVQAVGGWRAWTWWLVDARAARGERRHERSSHTSSASRLARTSTSR